MSSNPVKCAAQFTKENEDLQAVAKLSIKGSTMINLFYEVEDTDHIAENKQNIKGQLQFPVSTDFLDDIENTVQPSDAISQKVKKILVEDLREVGLLSKDSKSFHHKLDELNTAVYFSVSSDFDDIPLIYVNSLHLTVFYLIDDNFDKTFDNSDEFIIDERALELFMNCYLGIMDEKPFEDVDFNNYVQCKITGQVLNCLVKLIKRFYNFLKSNYPVYSDAKLREPVVKGWHAFFLASIWLRKFRMARDSLTDEMFFELRCCALGHSTATEFWALLKNIILDDDIRNDPIFGRILVSGCTATGIFNDIIGFTRELSGENNSPEDNYILFKFRQGLSLESAFELAHKTIEKACTDYISFTQRLRDRFSKNADLQNFFDINDFLFCNCMPMQVKMPRYKTKCWINGVSVAKFDL